MRKFLTGLLLAAVLLPALVFLGCNGDDDPAEPAVVPCSIIVSTPQGDTTFLHGEDVDIYWREKGDAENVSITLCKDGVEVGTIRAVAANTGYYFWAAQTYGAGSGTDYTIRITALGETGCTDDSGLLTLIDTAGCAISSPMSDYLVLAPRDTCFLSPMSLCVLDAGFELDLVWDSQSTSGTVDIELIRRVLSEETSIGMIAFDIPDEGAYSWVVDSFNYDNDALSYLVRISDHLVPSCQVEIGLFQILDSTICDVEMVFPNHQSNWTIGSTRTIVFEADPATATVEIRLYAGSTFLETIAFGVDPTAGEFDWTVTNFGFTGASSLYRIRILDEEDMTCFGLSETFTIPAK